VFVRVSVDDFLLLVSTIPPRLFELDAVPLDVSEPFFDQILAKNPFFCSLVSYLSYTILPLTP